MNRTVSSHKNVFLGHAEHKRVASRRAFARAAMIAQGMALSLLAFPLPMAHAQSEPAAEMSNTDLAKAIENPISDLYYIPFQNLTNFNVGPHKGTQDILNIQPVIPIHINSEWNVITRTIIPLVWNPSMQPGKTVPFGIAPITFSAFLTPAGKPANGLVWGVGPVVQIPAASSSTLGSSVWGGGPTAVIIKMSGPWVIGALINNVWSFGGDNGPTGKRAGGTGYSVMTLQPGINYNFSDGWFINSAPIITANWLTAGDKAGALAVYKSLIASPEKNVRLAATRGLLRVSGKKE